MAKKILVVDDEERVCWAFRELLEDEGYGVETASSAEEGLEKAEALKPHLIVLDVRLPGMDGLTAIEKFNDICDAPIVVITAHGTTQTAIEAIRLGAVDYILKPVEDIDSVLAVISKGLDRTDGDPEVAKKRAELSDRAHLDIMVGSSTPMQELFKHIGALARSDVTAIVRGESGTGKELCARLIHYNSNRRKNKFVIVNCASLPETLLESELFGHEKGSFTGAYREKKGYFEMADGGTLFLDEIGDFPPLSQVKLLNFLETRQFERVGGVDPINVDVRIITSTNRDLEKLVREGEFREDLYFRLNVAELSLPPSRRRGWMACPCWRPTFSSTLSARPPNRR
ncbi:MAG: sigma-54 dependent transcriptional regulator [Planctomycetota bacterium]|nr:sigma-54 dependent transcriptional regulator [Planctomycetota bacterium]